MNGPDENDDLLDRAARAMADSPPLGEFPAPEILRAVHSTPTEALRARLPHIPSAQPLSHRFIQRFRSTKPLYKLAASLLFAASVLGLTWALFHPAPVLAFATVAQHLHDARTLSADLTLQESSVAMTGKLYFSTPARYRIEFPGTPAEIADLETGRIVLIDHQSKTAILMHVDKKDVAPADDPTAQSLDWIEKLRNISHSAGQPLGEDDINGVRARQFAVTEDGQQVTIWADAKTGAPLRVESNLTLGGRHLKLTLDHLTLDQPLDNALFSTAIPAGYTQQEATVSAAVPGDADLITFFKAYTARTGVFPPSLNDFDKTLNPLVPTAAPSTQSLGADFIQIMVQSGRVMMLLSQLPPTADWHYAGANVKPTTQGAATKPIFWYHPKAASTWRIIYADLHTADVSSADMPRIPAETQPAAGK